MYTASQEKTLPYGKKIRMAAILGCLMAYLLAISISEIGELRSEYV